MNTEYPKLIPVDNLVCPNTGEACEIQISKLATITELHLIEDGEYEEICKEGFEPYLYLCSECCEDFQFLDDMLEHFKKSPEQSTGDK